MARSGVLRFLEAVQRPFDLTGQIWLGVPAPFPAHFIVSASLAGALVWWWRPKPAGILLGIVILAKEAVDLMIISLYEQLTWVYASGSVADVLVSCAGAGLGFWVATYTRRRFVEATETGSEPEEGDGAP